MRWLTPREAAEHARGSGKTIRKCVTSGRLEAARVNAGRNYVIAQEWIADFLTGSARPVLTEETPARRA